MGVRPKLLHTQHQEEEEEEEEEADRRPERKKGRSGLRNQHLFYPLFLWLDSPTKYSNRLCQLHYTDRLSAHLSSSYDYHVSNSIATTSQEFSPQVEGTITISSTTADRNGWCRPKDAIKDRNREEIESNRFWHSQLRPPFFFFYSRP